MPRSEAPQRAAAVDVVSAPSPMAVNRFRSMAAFRAAERWYAQMVSNTSSGEGIGGWDIGGLLGAWGLGLGA